jgi:hypothetical protein
MADIRSKMFICLIPIPIKQNLISFFIYSSIMLSCKELVYYNIVLISIAHSFMDMNRLVVYFLSEGTIQVFAWKDWQNRDNLIQDNQ